MIIKYIEWNNMVSNSVLIWKINQKSVADRGGLDEQKTNTKEETYEETKTCTNVFKGNVVDVCHMWCAFRGSILGLPNIYI